MTRTLAEEGLVLADGPRWRNDRLWFSDLYGGAVYTVDLEGNLERVLELEHSPSGLGFLDDGSWVVVSQQDQKLLQVSADGEVSVYADLSGVAVGDVNDIVIDSSGGIYVSCFGFDIGAGEPFHAAPLMYVAPDRSVSVVAEDLSFPNGIVLNDQEDLLLLAQSVASNILAFDRAPDGVLSNRRVWADLDGSRPDGICLDVEGAVWAGNIEGCQFLRVKEGGEILETIDTTPMWAIAPMLGGPDGNQLFLLTAAPLDPDNLKGAFHARVEVLEVAVSRAGRP